MSQTYGDQPVSARTGTVHRPVGPVAYDCVRVIVVRDGSAILFSEFGKAPDRNESQADSSSIRVHDVTHLPGRPKPNRSRRTPHTQTSRQTLSMT